MSWRLSSPVCAVLDGLVGAGGLALTIAALIDSVYSWPGDTVLVAPSLLERLAVILLFPCWAWMLLLLFAAGTSRRGRQRRNVRVEIWPRSAKIGVRLLAVAVTVVVVVGFVIGGAKGSLRVLPGGIHQVSTYDFNSGDWTTVSPRAYRRWEARFVREDGFFGLFGVGMIVFAAGTHYLRVRDRDQQPHWLSVL